ncbi:MAG: HAD-IA family hydrolase [Propionibacteriaceae bacterium]|nr:HAD-IA family hydrolase [Propionibacteriaceae bacterium]
MTSAEAMTRAIRLVAFDAMGVVFASGDDVGELLIPYLRGLGCTLDEADIQRWYLECSLGRMTSADFWERCGVSGDDEEYLESHRLTSGILDLLAWTRAQGLLVGLLSNDVAEWSALLRRRFGLDEVMDVCVISGDAGVRKPDPAIFRQFAAQADCQPGEILFFDDRPANIQAARDAGLTARLFADVGQARRVIPALLGGRACDDDRKKRG